MISLFFIYTKVTMINFNIVRQDRDGSTAVVEKDALTTDIVQGQFATIDPATGLAIKATAASTSIMYVLSVISDTKVLVSKDLSAVFEGTADAPFAKTFRNTEVDIAIDGDGNQLIDIEASTTDVLKVVSSEDGGTVGETTKVLVTINKPVAL